MLIGKVLLFGFIVVFRKKINFNFRLVFKNGIKMMMWGGMGCVNFVFDFMFLDYSLD